MYPFTIGNLKVGITRLRTKAGASKDALYDLVDAYLTTANTVEPRPGNKHVYDLPLGTKGLALFEGKRHTFSATYVAPPINPLYVVHILPHRVDNEAFLVKIHFAEPLLGYLFVVAEFSDGLISYYWLTEGLTGDVWQADTVYKKGALVGPTTPNGYYYSAERLNPPDKVWEPDVVREVGDVIEPTVYDGFEYVVIEVYGDSPRSGKTEPAWNAVEGGLTYEDAEKTPTAPTQTPPTTLPPPDVGGRYGGGGGGLDPRPPPHAP